MSFFRGFFREILLTLVALLALTFLLRWQGFASFVHEYTSHLLVFWLSLAFGVCLTLWSLRSDIIVMLKRQKTTPSELREPLGRFFRSQQQQQVYVRDALISPAGYQMGENELKVFIAACFETKGNRPYIGTDSNVPTVFYRFYPTYFDQQKINVGTGRDARILLATEDELCSDYQQNQGSKSVFQTFYDTHVQQHMRLLQVDRVIALEFAKAHGFPATDLGIFGWQFVVFYNPPVGATDAPLFVIHMEVLTKNRKKQIREYLLRLNDNAKEIILAGGMLQFGDRDPETQRSDRIRLVAGAE